MSSYICINVFITKKRPENFKTLKAYKCDKSEKCIKKSFFIYAVIITSKCLSLLASRSYGSACDCCKLQETTADCMRPQES